MRPPHVSPPSARVHLLCCDDSPPAILWQVYQLRIPCRGSNPDWKVSVVPCLFAPALLWDSQANEKLHQFFLQATFKAEQEVISLERIIVAKIKFVDNAG